MVTDIDSNLTFFLAQGGLGKQPLSEYTGGVS